LAPDFDLRLALEQQGGSGNVAMVGGDGLEPPTLSV
jgi:hypothetical protein